MRYNIDLSIIVPAFNTQNYIVETIESVIEQECHSLKYEIIIVNDASTDNTKHVLSILNDSRICLFDHSENKGLSATRNTGLKHATGKWVLFLDGDDRLEQGLFETFEKMQSEQYNCYIFSSKFEYEKHIEIHKITEIRDERAFAYLGAAWNKFIMKEICVEFQIGYLHEDIIFNVEMLNSAELKIALLPDVYYLYNRKNVDSITSKFNKKRFNEMFDYLFLQLPGSKNITKKYILEIAVGLLFYMPFFMSLKIATRATLRLFWLIPSVYKDGIRHCVKRETIMIK